jgi:hypothetical protein
MHCVRWPQIEFFVNHDETTLVILDEFDEGTSKHQLARRTSISR